MTIKNIITDFDILILIFDFSFVSINFKDIIFIRLLLFFDYFKSLCQ
jgi:hypothetical protein